MTSLSETPQTLYRLCQKLNQSATEIDPHIHLFAAVFQNLPLVDKEDEVEFGRWVNTIIDVACYHGLAPTSYFQLIREAAYKNNLINNPRDKMPKGMYMNLNWRGTALRHILESQNLGLGVSKQMGGV
ncbi:hypothetical protein HZB69_00925 [Candidatus Amesbacteria bacterium]|nr:hypothetical protein [Candidatus Amesbacteria bacterium]